MAQMKDVNGAKDSDRGRPPGQVSEYAFTGTRTNSTWLRSAPVHREDVYASVYVALGQFDMHKETFDHALVLLDVIETKPMETKMVTVDAPAMAKGIAAAGHIALYGGSPVKRSHPAT
jgi:hypothetical protein